jgi:hypothetical protein
MPTHRTARNLGVAAVAFLAFGLGSASANHPVLVEGNNAGNGLALTTVPPGTGGDHDGDGLVGVAEDTDNATDRIFGTLTAALLGANGGANANGHVIIVTSGRFNETISIPNAAAGQANVNGVTIVEAAPGVQANIDAVLAGDAAGNATRQAGVGITIDTPFTDRLVILRNLAIRNFRIGLLVKSNSRVVCENCRFDSNIDANVVVQDNARLTLVDCSVRAGGMRFNPVQAVANPGDGVAFEDRADGVISNCTITGNLGAGVRNDSKESIRVIGSTVFDNDRDFVGRIRTESAGHESDDDRRRD